MLVLAQTVGDFDLILNAADKAGVIALLFVFILALHKRWIVTGQTHADCVEEKTTLRTVLDAKANKVESDLERLREDREGHRGTAS